MANEKFGYITVQGDVHSRKGYEPSGYVVFSGAWPKTFRGSDGLKKACVFLLKKGYTPRLAKPEVVTGQSTLLDIRLDVAADAAKRELAAQAAALAAAAAAEDES